jgi:CHAT domain-containing protein
MAITTPLTATRAELSKLVVLNSCESGAGVYHSGEGVFSLARGFSYAGASSVLMNLWKIPDVPVVYLTEKFYQLCATGLSTDKALMQAKLDYLAQHDEYLSHPYFWSSLTLIGNNQPITQENKLLLPGAVAAAILILLYLLIAQRRKSNGRVLNQQ